MTLGVVGLVFIAWRLVLMIHAVRVVADFEGCPPTKVRKITNTRWVIYTEDKTWRRPHFFLFRVEGADGRTITFEIPNAPPKWRALNPVYSYATRLDDLAAFESAPTMPVAYRKAPNGPRLPDTSGQGWHFIEDVKLVKGRLRFRQKFQQDAYVCLTYPYTPGYHQRYLETLAGKPGVEVITVGTSKKSRPLQVVKIGEGGKEAEKWKPCVVIYAREHGDEQSSSWAAQGAIEFLVSGEPDAQQIRRRLTFIVIPMLDVDGAAGGIYRGIGDTFSAQRSSRTAEAYAQFFKSWVDDGKPLDLVMNLRSLETLEGQHLSPILSDQRTQQAQWVAAFCNRFVRPLIESAGLSVRFTADQTEDADGEAGLFPVQKLATECLANWLGDYYGSANVPFVLNSQTARRHLALGQLRTVGGSLASASARNLTSDSADALLSQVNAVRRTRAARWAKYGSQLPASPVLEVERKCKSLAQVDSPEWVAWRAERLRQFD